MQVCMRLCIKKLPDTGGFPSAGGTRRSPNNTRQTLYRQTLVCRVFVVGHSAKTLLSAQKTLGKLFFQKNKKRHADTTPAPPAPPPPSTSPPPRRGRREGPTTPHHHHPRHSHHAGEEGRAPPCNTTTAPPAKPPPRAARHSDVVIRDHRGLLLATPLSCDTLAAATSACRH